MTTANMHRAAETAQANGTSGRVVFLSLTVDPQRDTVRRMRRYSHLYGALPDWRLATGRPAQVTALWRALGVSTDKTKPEDTVRDWMTGKVIHDSYDVHHQDVVMVVGPPAGCAGSPSVTPTRGAPGCPPASRSSSTMRARRTTPTRTRAAPAPGPRGTSNRRSPTCAACTPVAEPSMRSATKTYTAAERSPWRWPAAAAALTMTAAHIPVTAEHLSEAPYIGWSFVALEVAGFALAVVLVLRDTRRAWWVAAVVPALAMLAYVVTRSVPLPQIADDVGNWVEPLGLVALTAEALLIAIALAHAFGPPRRPGCLPNPVVLAAVGLAVGLAAPATPPATVRRWRAGRTARAWDR